MKVIQVRHESKTKLLDAALHVFRVKGYAATRIEDICEAAELTKGSFFHHFKSKEELAVAAADYWTEVTGGFFATAEYQKLPTALERLLAYIDLRKALLTGDMAAFTCLVGTMVQETYASNPAIREACERSISGHAMTLENDIASAMRENNVTGAWTAKSLALYTQTVIQGAFVLAKAQNDPTVAVESLNHLRHYLELLFSPVNS